MDALVQHGGSHARSTGGRLGLIGSKRVVGGLVAVVLVKSLLIAAFVQTSGADIAILGVSDDDGSLEDQFSDDLPRQDSLNRTGQEGGQDSSTGTDDATGGGSGGGSGEGTSDSTDKGICVLSACVRVSPLL